MPFLHHSGCLLNCAAFLIIGALSCIQPATPYAITQRNTRHRRPCVAGRVLKGFEAFFGSHYNQAPCRTTKIELRVFCEDPRSNFFNVQPCLCSNKAHRHRWQSGCPNMSLARETTVYSLVTKLVQEQGVMAMLRCIWKYQTLSYLRYRESHLWCPYHFWRSWLNLFMVVLHPQEAQPDSAVVTRKNKPGEKVTLRAKATLVTATKKNKTEK